MKFAHPWSLGVFSCMVIATATIPAGSVEYQLILVPVAKGKSLQAEQQVDKLFIIILPKLYGVLVPMYKYT